MRFTILINQQRATEWGLNCQQAILFSFLYGLPSWANEHIKDGQSWYNISKNKICQELPILTDKADTAYRMLKQLEDKGLISVGAFDNKTYVRVTKKGKSWDDTGSEKNPNSEAQGSEKNPSRVGKISDELDNKELNNKSNSKKSKTDLTFSQWASQCKENGETLLPSDSGVFAYARTIGLPEEYLRIGWETFKRDHMLSNKKQKDWRLTFLTYVRKGYLKVWYLDQMGVYQLTTAGKQAMMELSAA